MNTTRTKTLMASGKPINTKITVVDLAAQLDAAIWNWSKDNPSANVFDIKFNHTVQMNIHYFTAVICFEIETEPTDLVAVQFLACAAVDSYQATDIDQIEGDDEDHEHVKDFQKKMIALRSAVNKYRDF